MTAGEVSSTIEGMKIIFTGNESPALLRTYGKVSLINK